MRTGQFTNLDMRHYRFPRTCEGFKGEKKFNVDRMVFIAAVIIAAGCLIASVLS